MEGFTPHDHELATAERLVAAGFDVDFLAPLREPGVKNPDVRIDGEPWEMKSPTGNGKNTISNQLKRGRKQADCLIIDTSRTPLHDEDVMAELRRRTVGSPLAEIVMVDKAGMIYRMRRP